MKKLISVIALFSACAILLCSCGSSYASNSYYDKSYVESGAMDFEGVIEEDVADMDWNMSASEPMAPAEAPAAGNPDTDSLKQSQRKIIKTKELSVETLEFDTFISELEKKISEYGGYIENSTHNGQAYYRSNLRSANYTIRIPAERFDEFTSIIGNMAAVTYTYEYIDDITAKYVDVEARLEALKAERDSYLKLMEKAETIEDILKVQEYLTNANYQIESYTAQLNSYKSLVSYSTLRLDITEVERITPQTTVRPGVFERIKTNLSSNLYDIGEGAKDLFVGVVSSSPYLAILAVIAVVIFIIVKVIIKKNRATEKKRYEMLSSYQQPTEAQPAVSEKTDDEKK